MVTTDLPLKLFARGKVRDTYELSDGRLLLASLPPFRVWHDRDVVEAFLLVEDDRCPKFTKKFGPVGLRRSLPAYPASDFSKLVECIKQVHSLRSDVFSTTVNGSDRNGIAIRL